MGCCLCDCVETVNHLFFKCHLAKLVWGLLQNIFELDSCPRSLEDLSITWLQGKGPLPNRLIIFFFAGFAWALWTTRNKMAIEKSFVKTPTDVIYVAISLLQRWSVLLKEKDRERVSQASEAILRWLKNFSPRLQWQRMSLRSSWLSSFLFLTFCNSWMMRSILSGIVMWPVTPTNLVTMCFLKNRVNSLFV